MKKHTSSTKLTSFIFLFPILVLLLYGLLSHVFFFYTKQKENVLELQRYKQTLFDIEQNRLKEKVNNFVQFIHYYDSRNSDKIKKDAKSIVSLAVNIVNNIYHKNKDKLSTPELKQLIIDTLSNVKFEGDLGYMFLIDMQGIAYVHIDPKIINKNILDIQDINGKYIIREFNKVLKEKGEGFVDYYWYINQDGHKQMHYKISYVKLLDCYGWYIGAGEYLRYMKQYTREDILKFLKDNHAFKDGFFYIRDVENHIVYQPKNTKLSYTQLISYSTKSRDVKIDDNYMSYTIFIPEYQWYITAIKDLTNINTQISTKQKLNKKSITKKMKTNLYLIIFSLVLSILLSIYLSVIINRRLKKYQMQIEDNNNQLIFQSKQALLGELLPMIAHQWRQPINKIASITAILRFLPKHDSISIAKLDKYCKDIESNVEFMSETIDEFREFYQPKKNTATYNLEELILKSVDFVDWYIRKKDISVNMSLEKNLYYKLSSNEFLQIMINLIKNAIDILDSGGHITIRLYKHQNSICISVTDDGEGISTKDLHKIFQPYYTTKENSMGLGLYMSKIIVEKHLGGELHVKRLKRGTRFVIVLFDKDEE